MSRGPLEPVEPASLADRRARVEARVALAGLTRLAALLEETAGEADCILDFSRDEHDRILVDGRTTALLRLRCQRCLEPVSLEVEAEFRLAVLDDDRQAAELPDGVEPVLREKRLLDLQGMIEDELLLNLPQIARHATPEECGALARALLDAPGADDGAAAEKPFAVLRRLKHRKDG